MVRRPLRHLVRVAAAVAAMCLGAAAGLRAQEPLPSARDVIDRYVKACGGADALKAIQSFRAHGTIAIPTQGLSGDIDLMAARPNKVITRVNMAGMGQIEEGFDGKVGWSIDPINGPSLAAGKMLSERADEAWFDSMLHATDYVKEMTVVGREQFDQRPAVRVRVVLLSGNEQFEIFDEGTGFQIGLEATRTTPFGPVPTTTVYRNYQKFGELTMPSLVIQRLLGVEQVATIASYEFDALPLAAFDLPPVIRALIK
jgi:hypothetical protein